MRFLWLLIPAAYLLGQRNARSEKLDYQVLEAKSGEQWRFLPKGTDPYKAPEQNIERVTQALKDYVQSYHVEGSYLVVTFSKDFTFTIPGMWFQSANKVREA